MTANNNYGAVVWVTGLPSAGKTTVAKLVMSRLRAQGRSVVHLDGDDIRRTLPQIGYDREERLALARHYSGLAHILQQQGFTVVVSTVSLFREIHSKNRALFPNYLEVLLSAPPEVLQERHAGRIQNLPPDAPVIGVDIPPELPDGNDVLRLENHGDVTADVCAEAVLRSFSQSC